jgi:hypothetical protein
MTKNSEIFFCAHKSKIYEVAKNNEIDRRMSKENDIKHKKKCESCSHGDLDNLKYFYYFFRTRLVLFIDFTSFGKSTNSRI